MGDLQNAFKDVLGYTDVGRKELDEERDMEEINSWFDEATNISTMSELENFITKLNNRYIHDYGTIVHAMTAGCIATLYMMDRQDQGGITGFQASCIMWGFIKRWMSYDGPMVLRRYRYMLYPQYEKNFEKTISRNVWEWLQKEASNEILKVNEMDPQVRQHIQSIVDGVVPFGYTIVED